MKSQARSTPYQRLCGPIALVALLGAPAANATSYQETVKADNPIAYYRFEDPAGATTVVDSSTSGANPGTLVFDDYGAWPQLAQAGLGSNSIAFHPYTDEFGNAEKSYVTVPYSADLNPAGTFTTECWVRATTWGTGSRCFLSSFQNYNAGWWFRQEAGTSARWLYVHNGGGIYMAAGNIAKGEWTHLVVTYDGTTVRFYANGEQKWTAAGTVPAPNATGPLCVGGDPAIGDGFFDGNVDEVAIYAAALTVDQIKLHYAVGVTNFAVPPVPAKVVTDPVAASAYAGRTATFSVTADGTTPLSYQWYRGSEPIAGATKDILTFACAYADNGAAYKVVVTNLYGAATSAPAALTVMTDLTVASSPASITRNVGSKAAFIAITGGALPVTYQWYKGTAPIAGETNQTLWLSNLQLASDQTTYYAHISNPWTNTDSEVATLTVVPRAVTVPITGYAKVVMADDPVAFWRLDEPDGSATAVDAAGSFDAAYLPGAGTITYGVDTGIPHETNKAVFVTGKAQAQAPWALELNPHGAFSAELWIKPAALNPGPDFIDVATSEGLADNGPHGWLLYQMLDNTLVWVLFSRNWNAGWLAAGPAVEADKWYHIVLACDGSYFRSYCNGSLIASQAYGGFVPNGDGWTSLGFRFDGGGSGFNGAIDDVAFYNKALTSDQVQAHYNATVKLTITRSGNNVVLSWPFGTLQQADQVDGAYSDLSTASSPFTTAASGKAKFYRVRVQ